MKAAIITGGATGLGARTAIELAGQGISIGVNYVRSKDEAEELIASLRSNFDIPAVAIQGDVAKSDGAAQVMDEMFRVFGRVDILINNAGPFIQQHKRMADYSEEEWYHMLDGNLSSAFFMSKNALRFMREQKWGRIINIGYERAETAPGWIYRSAYAAAKTGLVSLTRTLALEEAENGITVNMVCPGDIKIPWKTAAIEQVRLAGDKPALGRKRTGTGEDIGRVIKFLCDRDSDLITGAVISVTGAIDVLSKHRFTLPVDD